MKKLLNLLFFIVINCFAQHHSKLVVEVDNVSHVLTVKQQLTYFNESATTLNSIILNDWNNAYSAVDSPLGKRFSDEFIRTYLFAPEKDYGRTFDLQISDKNNKNIFFVRPENYPDLVEIQLDKPLLPNQKIEFVLLYKLKIPNSRFTTYGFNSKNEMALKNWFLTPAKFDKNDFVRYNNLNLDDAPNGIFDMDLEIKSAQNFEISSDLYLIKKDNFNYTFSGKNLILNNLYIQEKADFEVFKNNTIIVATNLQAKKVTDIEKGIIVDKIVNFVHDKLGSNNQQKILVSQSDYDQNPFYGLNQLPSFLRPFKEDFIFEIKFLKTYLNNYLKTSMSLDNRKDNWVFDAIQMYYLMAYMDENYPDAKMMGNLAKYKLLKSFNLLSLDFNEQFSYFYLLMARKNIDQPLSFSKDKLIKFNEKIASKYRAGLSFRYLNSYLQNGELDASIKDFFAASITSETKNINFETFLKQRATKDIGWFVPTLINSRDAIDYKLKNVVANDSVIRFEIKNKTATAEVPVSIFGIKNKKIVFKQWLTPKKDSVYSLQRVAADKLIINYQNEVPEFNLRNNWKALGRYSIVNKPIKFNFMKDLEDPKYTQILYVPSVEFNYYDGIIFGLRFHNKTVLDRPFNFDVVPSYSSKSKNFSGSFSFVVNDFNRKSSLFNAKYGLSGSTFQYAPDASYQKINPYLIYRFRPDDYRNNEKEVLVVRQIFVNRQKSTFVTNTFEGSYSIFNVRYGKSKPEILKTIAYNTDLQIAKNFGKLNADFTYRRLFSNSRQINLRFYAGLFLYNNTNSSFFNIALDRPTDYLFDFNYLGRSESTGLLSQEFIAAEGGFKSKVANPSSDQFLTTVNASFNIWNWVEVYGDVGLIKNKIDSTRFLYDSGIRLNLVPDYFELYFPIQSSNGFEMGQKNYQEKIRFVVAFNPNTLLGLFTRKWF